MTPVASIIIPSYNHARWLAAAIDSCLAQTVPCEVIVVDDGSTDHTAEVLAAYEGRIRIVSLPHGGPSIARNAGLDLARGEFVMLLDADDVIEPTKVERQLQAFTDEIGWVLCDVLIQDEAKSRTEQASVRYDYARRNIGGWITEQLTRSNFIPIMSPLVRRSVISDVIRFNDDRVPEDWHFWLDVAKVARARYVPEVLATYRKRRQGRSRLPLKARKYMPNITDPLRLNLGCGNPRERSWHPIDGLVNMDKSLGWSFEDGLGDFVDHSVSGITISHALMYVPVDKWPYVFSEFARVLAPGGVVRITEDVTDDPKSRRFGGWQGSEPAVTLTTTALVRRHLEQAGLVVHELGKHESKYRDLSLCQAQHGDDVFFLEGVKLDSVLFAPHSDDETLFAAFTILKYRPRVVVCFPSAGDYGDTATREQETRDAMGVLGGGPVEQWSTARSLVEQMRDFDGRVHPLRVWAPHPNASHPDHVAVAVAALDVFGDRVRQYHTYNANGKVREGVEVAFEPAWIQQKLRALARYTSQIAHPRAHAFFLDDLREYVP